MPTISAHVPEDWGFKEQFSSRINTPRYRNKPSPYLVELIERDLSGLSIGTPDSAYSHEQIKTWMEDERTLLDAARIALTVLNGADPKAREVAARELAEKILGASLRQPALAAAEDPGSYHAGAELTPEERKAAAQNAGTRAALRALTAAQKGAPKIPLQPKRVARGNDA
jgi:hypothetical protein